MNETNTHDKSTISKGSWTVIVSLLLLALLLVWVIFSTEPEAKREGATKKTPMLVEVITVERRDHTPTLKAMGTVEPARVIELAPQVAGQVIEVAAQFEPGAVVTEGQTLLQIDPVDYQLAVTQHKAAYQQAKAALSIEQGEQQRAASDYRSLNNELTGLRKELVLRQPQLQTAEAEVEAAKAQLEKAQRDLQRTTVVAPFDGQIISRSVELGASVSAGRPIAKLQGNERYWVKVSLPAAKLHWLPLDHRTQAKACSASNQTVILRHRTAWPKDAFRRGCLKHFVGELTTTTRMVQLLIEVNDPLALNSDQPNRWPLLAGAYVAAEIPAKTLTQVVRLPIQLLRKNDTVWLLQNDQLSIQPVSVALRDERYAYINGGLETNDRVITTDLSTVKQGASVQLKARNQTNSDASAESNEH